MNDTPKGNSETAAEQRLLAYLDGLRAHPPRPQANLVAAVMRTARWQAPARPYLAAMGSMAGAFGAGMTVLLGDRGRE
jgi:hypothetical protein